MFRALLAITTLTIAALVSGGADSVAAGGGCHTKTLTDETGTAVDLSGNCFTPTVIRVDTGGTITWTNRDEDAMHTVTGAAGSFGDYTEFSKGESRSYTFEQAGVFPYFCVIHPSMIGAVVVGSGELADATSEASLTAANDTSGDGDALGATGIAGAIAAISFGGLALGLVGSRTLSRRRVS